MEEKKVKNKTRKVFLEDLPKLTGKGFNNKKQVIDWIKSAELKIKVKFIYDDIEGYIEIVGYDGKNLYIKYLDKNNYKIYRSNFIKCRLSNLLGLKTSDFKIDINQVFQDNKRNIIITDRKYRKNNNENRKFYKYSCYKCNYTGWVLEGNLLKGYGCACCCTPSRIVVQGINDIPTTAPFMVKFFQGGYDEAKKYSKGSNKKIYPICPDCGIIKDKEMIINKIYQKKSISCACGDGFSYPEKFMFFVLEQLKLEFTTQYSPDWIKPMRYDFYFELNGDKYIIETDGGLGHGKKSHGKSDKTKEETKLNDDYKEMMADQHGIEVIRIDCDESDMNYIKDKVLNSKLSELFDLLKINWLKCEEFALGNRVKEACEMKCDNPDYTASEIGKMMNLNKNTIRNYLVKGSKLGWCDYDPKEEIKKNNERKKKLIKNLPNNINKKQVEILKDGVSLGFFKNCTELSRKSEELFGVKLDNSKISSVIRGERKHHKEFTFKYTEKLNKELII